MKSQMFENVLKAALGSYMVTLPFYLVERDAHFCGAQQSLRSVATHRFPVYSVTDVGICCEMEPSRGEPETTAASSGPDGGSLWFVVNLAAHLYR